MQFHLESDEIQLLANILLEQDSRQYNELFQKVMARDLRLDADELEDASELLTAKKQSLKDEIARQPDPKLKVELERKLEILERALYRVNEACMMF